MCESRVTVMCVTHPVVSVTHVVVAVTHPFMGVTHVVVGVTYGVVLLHITMTYVTLVFRCVT